MISKKIKSNSGFVALMSGIIISVILLLVVTNLSFTSFYSRSDILDSELKERSSSLAEACVDVALINLAQSKPMPPNPIPVGSDSCNIISAVSPVIKTQASFNNAYTNLTITIDSNYNILSWEETPN